MFWTRRREGHAGKPRIARLSGVSLIISHPSFAQPLSFGEALI